MDFDYDADQRGLLEFGRELAGRFEDRYWQEIDEEYRFPQEFWTALTEHGLLGIAVPEEYGGSGKGLLELTIAVEGIAEGGGGMEGGTLLVSGPVFGGCLITRHGNEKQKAAYLPGLATGDLWAGAFTEPESGSNISAIKTGAERRGDSYVVNGQKVYISQVGNAQHIVVMARTAPYDEAHRTRGISLLLGDLPSDAVRGAPVQEARQPLHGHEPRLLHRLRGAGREPRRRGGQGLGARCTTSSTPSASSSRPRRSGTGNAGDQEGGRVRGGAARLGEADRRPPGRPVPARAGADRPLDARG